MKQRFLLSMTLASLGFLSLAPSAAAAENVMLRYRGFSRTVAVADLATLAETGEVPASLAGLLRQVGQPPDHLRTLLNHALTADVVTLDKVLSSLPGEWMLDQVGQAIRPVREAASRQALRAALVLSASDDGEITLLEVLQAYPTETVVLEVEQIQSVYERFSSLVQPISQVLSSTLLDLILQGGF